MSVDVLFDSGLRIPDAAQVSDLEEQELKRCTKNARVLHTIGKVPKRLGHDVSDRVRAEDRRLARRLTAVYEQQCRFYHRPVDLTMAPSHEVYGEAARLRWEPFFDGLGEYIEARRRLVWTTALHVGELKEGRALVHRLDWELDQAIRCFEAIEPIGSLAPEHTRMRLRDRVREAGGVKNVDD